MEALQTYQLYPHSTNIITSHYLSTEITLSLFGCVRTSYNVLISALNRNNGGVALEEHTTCGLWAWNNEQPAEYIHEKPIVNISF
jgi:hypothetical protein